MNRDMSHDVSLLCFIYSYLSSHRDWNAEVGGGNTEVGDSYYARRYFIFLLSSHLPSDFSMNWNTEVRTGIQKLGIRIFPDATSSSFCLPIFLLPSFSSQIYSTSHFGLPPHRCHRSPHLRHRSYDNSVPGCSACCLLLHPDFVYCSTTSRSPAVNRVSY